MRILLLCSWPFVDIKIGKRQRYHAQKLVYSDEILMQRSKYNFRCVSLSRNGPKTIKCHVIINHSIVTMLWLTVRTPPAILTQIRLFVLRMFEISPFPEILWQKHHLYLKSKKQQFGIQVLKFLTTGIPFFPLVNSPFTLHTTKTYKKGF